jgi:hypothetical protein
VNKKKVSASLFLPSLIAWTIWFLFYFHSANLSFAAGVTLYLEFLVVAFLFLFLLSKHLFAQHSYFRVFFVVAIGFLLWWLLWRLVGTPVAYFAAYANHWPTIGNAPIYLDDMVELRSYAAFATLLLLISLFNSWQTKRGRSDRLRIR